MRLVVIKHSLDLDLRLLDTATGQPVPPPSVVLYRDGKLVHPMLKPSGHFILMGQGRQNFMLTVQVEGYLPQTLPVDYATMDTILPHITTQLVPDRLHGPGYPMLELGGNKKGLLAVLGVPLNAMDCFMQSYDAKRRVITISNSNQRNFDRQHFARLDAKLTCFEPFFVVRSLSMLQLEVRDELQTDFSTLCPVAPICFGAVMSNGDYWFRVRDEGNNPRWLIRYQTTDGEYFENVDLTARGGAAL